MRFELIRKKVAEGYFTYRSPLGHATMLEYNNTWTIRFIDYINENYVNDMTPRTYEDANNEACKFLGIGKDNGLIEDVKIGHVDSIVKEMIWNS